MGAYSRGGMTTHTRRLILVIIAIAILLDNMLLTTVVPILPSYLYKLRQEEQSGNTFEWSKDISDQVTPSTTAMFEGEGPLLLQQLATRAPPSSRWDVPGPTLVPLSMVWMSERHLLKNSSMKHSTNNVASPPTDSPDILRHQELVDETTEVGLMFASKPILQAIANPFIGRLCSKIGFTIPMFLGFILIFVSTLVFALGNSYPLLFIARSIQGVGSSCTSVSGMGLIASLYSDDRERGNAMAFALGGLAFGVLIGPPFGGLLYQFVGKASPFLLLAFLTLVDGMLQLIVLRPRVHKEDVPSSTMVSLLKDPYIIVAAASIAVANMGISILEPSLPLWMMDTMNAEKWTQGMVFLPSSISYLVGTNLFGALSHKIGRWLSTMIGLCVIATSILCIPFATRPVHLIVPNAGIGFAIGMVDSSMMPMLGHLVDIRHTSDYGIVYAIGDVAFCVSFVLGPLFSSVLVKTLGFSGLIYTISAACFAYAPLTYILRNPPSKQEIHSILNKGSTVAYQTHNASPSFSSPEPESPTHVSVP